MSPITSSRYPEERVEVARADGGTGSKSSGRRRSASLNYRRTRASPSVPGGHVPPLEGNGALDVSCTVRKRPGRSTAPILGGATPGPPRQERRGESEEVRGVPGEDLREVAGGEVESSDHPDGEL